jgi:hypothetical protein
MALNQLHSLVLRVANMRDNGTGLERKAMVRPPMFLFPRSFPLRSVAGRQGTEAYGLCGLWAGRPSRSGSTRLAIKASDRPLADS